MTGVFIGEALHPYNVLRAAGFTVDIASEKGEWSEDWLSLEPGFLSTDERKQYDDKGSEFRKEMDAKKKAADLEGVEVSCVYLCEVVESLWVLWAWGWGLRRAVLTLYVRCSMASSLHRRDMRL